MQDVVTWCHLRRGEGVDTWAAIVEGEELIRFTVHPRTRCLAWPTLRNNAETDKKQSRLTQKPTGRHNATQIPRHTAINTTTVAERGTRTKEASGLRQVWKNKRSRERKGRRNDDLSAHI